MFEKVDILLKAYRLMAIRYCEHTQCCYCEVKEKCVEYRGKIKGAKHLENYFIKEAQKEAEK